MYNFLLNNQEEIVTIALDCRYDIAVGAPMVMLWAFSTLDLKGDK
jgi:hypothetical protein